jgi:uncharacterized protein YjbJ (UPF0337 family)
MPREARNCIAESLERSLSRNVDMPIQPAHRKGEDTMNKDRVEGSFEQAKGKVKEVAGKVTGDSKLEAEGKGQKIAGKVQNSFGGFKDAVKQAVDD